MPSFHFVFPDFSIPPSALLCDICGQTFLIGNFAIGLSLPPPKRDGPIHPFADERATWGDVPKIAPTDLFS